jgi:hypothetical protein
MSDYEKELERTVDELREKLQDAMDRQERMTRAVNAELFDVKALIGKLSDNISSLKKMDTVDYGLDESNEMAKYKKDKRAVEKTLLSIHDSLHDRVIQLLDRFKD